MRRGSRTAFTSQTRRLFSGQALAQAGDGLVQAGFAQLIIFEIPRGSRPAAIAGVLAATLLPYSLLGPVAGIVIDRYDRRSVLATSAVARSALTVSGIAAWAAGSVPIAMVAVLALTSIGRFLLAAKSAALPRALGLAAGDLAADSPGASVVRDEALESTSLLARANAFSSALGVVSVFAGAVAGTALVSLSTPLAFVCGSVAYAGASLAFLSLRAMPPPYSAEEGRERGAISIAVAGLTEEIRRASKRQVGIPLGALAWHRTALGSGLVVVVLIADSKFGLQLPGYTGALVVAGTAALVGSALAPVVLTRASFSAVVASSFVVAAGATMVAAIESSIPSLVVALSGAAVAFQVLKVGVDTVLQQRAPDLVRGRVFSLQDAAYNGCFVLGAAAVAPLWGRVDPAAMLIGTALFFGMGAISLPAFMRHGPGPGTALAVLLSGATALAFPAPSLWPVAFLSLAPLIYKVSVAGSYRRAALIGWLGGAAFFVTSHYWMAHKTLYFQPVIAAVFGLTWIPWSLAARATLGNRRFVHGLVVVPAVWVLSEYLRAWDALGGPWAVLGASQWSVPWGLEAASWGGIWLVSWVLVAFNTSLVALGLASALPGASAAGRHRRHKVSWAGPVAVAVVVAVAWVAYAARGAPSGYPVLHVAGVQPGVIDPVEERFQASEAITEELGRGHDLIVWGESSLGEDPFLDSRYMVRLESLSRRANAPLLANVDARTGTGSIFKTALLVKGEGPVARYDKRRLVPFGEYVPLRPVFGWVTRFTDAADEDRGRGTSDVVMELPGTTHSIAPLICFESAFPDMTRSVARKGADVIVIQSANTTFQKSWLPDQHASLAAVRAAESGTPVVHATISGVSAAFDADGKRLVWVGTDYTGSWSVDLPVYRRETFYLRFGDWVILASVAMTIIAGLAAFVRRRSGRLASEGLADESRELPGNRRLDSLDEMRRGARPAGRLPRSPAL